MQPSPTASGEPQPVSSFARDLLRLALPIVLQNLAAALVGLLATVMVGSLGAASLAGVGLGNQVYFLLTLFLFGVSTGGGVFLAQYWGKRDLAGLRRSFGLALTIGLGTGLAFTLAALALPRLILGLYSADAEVVGIGSRYLRIVAWSYLPTAFSMVLGISLRSVERVRPPLVAATVSLALNLLLAWVLIFGKLGSPVLGVEGAAWATVAARLVEALILAAVAIATRAPILGSLRDLLDWRGSWPSRYLAVAWPVIVNEVTWSLGITLYNVVFARIDTLSIAAYNIVNTFSQLAVVVFFGAANAAAVMIGKKIGEGNSDLAFAWAKRFALLAPLFGLLMSVLILPFRMALPILYDLDAKVLAEASTMLLVLAAIFPFKVFNLTLIVGICRAGGDTKFSMYYDLAGVWGLGVPLAALGAFVLGLPAWAVFLLTASDEIAKSFVGVWRLLSRRWLRNVTV
jgi:putative MATE family efflux protein